MQTARRLYVYLLSGISLGALVIGITMLLTVLFEALGLGPRARSSSVARMRRGSS